jgi:hypothetical protein
VDRGATAERRSMVLPGAQRTAFSGTIWEAAGGRTVAVWWKGKIVYGTVHKKGDVEAGRNMGIIYRQICQPIAIIMRTWFYELSRVLLFMENTSYYFYPLQRTVPPTKFIISSYFWAKKFFFAKLSYGYPLNFFRYWNLYSNDLRIGQSHFGLGHCLGLENSFFRRVTKTRRLSPNFVITVTTYNDDWKQRMLMSSLLLWWRNSMNFYKAYDALQESLGWLQ